MSKKTVGIIMPGDMGHGCGKVFLENNFRKLLFNVFLPKFCCTFVLQF